MRILYVSFYYHPFMGGSESQTRLIAQALAQRHEVQVVAMNFASSRLPARLQILTEGFWPPPFATYQDGATPVHSLQPSLLEKLLLSPLVLRAVPRLRTRYWTFLRRLGYRFYRRVYVPKLRALLKDFDVVHCGYSKGYLGWAALEAARAEGIPFVITPYVHPGDDGDDHASVQMYKEADIVFGLLETDREYLLQLGVQRERTRLSGVVPLLPDSTDPNSFRARYSFGHSPLVLFIGRTSEYKGVRALLEAAPIVWQQHPDVRFLFIGPHSTDASTNELLTSFPDSRVRYLGLVSEQEKGDALAACDLFAMPSLNEILPAAYLEAWTYGKAVIGGTAPGLSELIEGNGGGVTVGHEPKALASLISELLQDETRRKEMGERGRALVKARFSEEALVRVHEEAYEELVETRPASHGSGQVPAKIGA